MKQAIITCFAFLSAMTSLHACQACEKQQPTLLKGITHGAGPESNWDMIIFWAMVMIVTLTLWLSVKFLVRPGERSPHHIKRTIFHED